MKSKEFKKLLRKSLSAIKKENCNLANVKELYNQVSLMVPCPHCGCLNHEFKHLSNYIEWHKEDEYVSRKWHCSDSQYKINAKVGLHVECPDCRKEFDIYTGYRTMASHKVRTLSNPNEGKRYVNIKEQEIIDLRKLDWKKQRMIKHTYCWDVESAFPLSVR